MAENVEFDSAPKFREKLETVKESYFPKTKIEEATSKDEVDSVAANIPADFTGTVRCYGCIHGRYYKNLKIFKSLRVTLINN